MLSSGKHLCACINLGCLGISMEPLHQQLNWMEPSPTTRSIASLQETASWDSMSLITRDLLKQRSPCLCLLSARVTEVFHDCSANIYHTMYSTHIFSSSALPGSLYFSTVQGPGHSHCTSCLWHLTNIPNSLSLLVLSLSNPPPTSDTSCSCPYQPTFHLEILLDSPSQTNPWISPRALLFT